MKKSATAEGKSNIGEKNVPAVWYVSIFKYLNAFKEEKRFRMKASEQKKRNRNPIVSS